MARRNLGVAAALLSLPIAGACTVFNGKTFTPDAGMSGADASAVDGGDATSDGASRCDCPSGPGIICEDFEGAALRAPWMKGGDTPPELDTAQPHCGKGSLHVSVPSFGASSTSASFIEHPQLLTDSQYGKGLYARAWVYIPKRSAFAGQNYFILAEVRQNADPFLGIGLQLHDKGSGITNWTPTPSETVSTQEPFARDVWTCVEWQVAFGATGESRFWLGGAPNPAASLAPTRTAPNPPYGAFLIGAYFSSEAEAQPAFDFWIDDVVVSPERVVGCPQ